MSDLRYPIGRFSPPPTYTPGIRAEFIAQLMELPSELRKAVKSLNPEQLQTPYRPDGWTVAQVVHHLPDSHMNSYVRMRLALTEENPVIKPYDETRWAELADAKSSHLDDSLHLVDSLHGRWVALLKSLAPADFDRPFVHPERGPMTIDRALALYAWHGRHHVAHVVNLRQARGW